MNLLLKYFVTAGIIVLISEVAKKLDRVGALISALPLVTLSVMIWMYIENVPTEKIANHSLYTFWFVLPTLPVFLVTPWLLNRGFNFWVVLGIGIIITALFFLLTHFFAKFFDLSLLG